MTFLPGNRVWLGKAVVKKYVEEYLNHLRERGMSPRTISDLQRRINYFYVFLRRKKILIPKRQAFLDYHRYLTHTKKYQGFTVRSRLFAIRAYFSYLAETKRFLFNPAAGLAIPKKSRTLPRDIPTPQEMRNVLDGIDTVGRVGKRRKAILELLYSTGIRANELLSLDIYDVDFKKGTIHVRQGKGGKDRVVPFGEKAKEALKVYIEEVRRYHADMTGEKKLFLSMWGRKLKYKELILVMHGASVKGKPLRAHSLRHACAIGMIQNGADIRYVQELLGHSSINSTQIYTRLMPADMKKLHTRYHPRALICGKTRS